jgi:hypothetical protein
MNSRTKPTQIPKNIFVTVLLLIAPLLAADGLGSNFRPKPALAQAGLITASQLIGRSVQGRPIQVQTLGDGPVDLLIVGGIHGGYEANSVVLARKVIQYFQDNSNQLPERFTLHVIDLMNPDGLHRITGGIPAEEFDFRGVNTRPGRFNANGVDLNRNWGADWKPVSYWGTTQVNTGTGPWSEPETRAVRDYFQKIEPVASIFFQSAGSFLWYSGAERSWAYSRDLAQAYSEASGYFLRERSPDEPRRNNPFEITGSSDDWFFSIGHRNITVELTNHYEIEWERNLAGLMAVLAKL